MKNIFLNKKFLILLLAVIYASSAVSQNSEKVSFKEIWGYLMSGEEHKFTGKENVTDIMYFGARIDDKGRLVYPPNPPDLGSRGNKNLRFHLVIYSINDSTMLNLCLDKRFSYRKNLLEDIITASKNYHGIHIDFETVKGYYKTEFLEFLGEIKEGLAKEKIFTVLVMPRRITVKDDPYDYGAIARIADRVFVMAYDQHYSTSAPGPIAGYEWCEKLISYALKFIPKEKLIMGIPFYGRAWQDNKTSGSLHYPDVLRLLDKHNIKPDYCEKIGASFTYTEKATVTVYYENAESILSKSALYRSHGVRGVGFWRIGQEDKSVWDNIYIEPEKIATAEPDNLP